MWNATMPHRLRRRRDKKKIMCVSEVIIRSCKFVEFHWRISWFVRILDSLSRPHDSTNFVTIKQTLILWLLSTNDSQFRDKFRWTTILEFRMFWNLCQAQIHRIISQCCVEHTLLPVPVNISLIKLIVVHEEIFIKNNWSLAQLLTMSNE